MHLWEAGSVIRTSVSTTTSSSHTVLVMVEAVLPEKCLRPREEWKRELRVSLRLEESSQVNTLKSLRQRLRTTRGLRPGKVSSTSSTTEEPIPLWQGISVATESQSLALWTLNSSRFLQTRRRLILLKSLMICGSLFFLTSSTISFRVLQSKKYTR